MCSKQLFLALFSLVLLSSCASSYKSINPNTFEFTNTEITEDVVLKYRYNVLRERRNKKFAKDEDQNNLRLMAVEITNNSNQEILLGDNLKLYNGDSEVQLVSPLSAKSDLRQCAGCYIPYALLTLLNLNIQNGNRITSIPIGLVVGPLVTGANIITASNANRRLKNAMIRFDLLNKTILPGKTETGLITISTREYPALKPRLILK